MSNIIPLDYEGLTVQFTREAWFCATTAAARFGKQPKEWLRLPDTKEYLTALESTYGKIPYVKTSRARVDRGGGTWLHPKLAVPFARWLDVRFAVWADHQIDLLIRGEVDVRRARHQAAVSFKLMSDMLKLGREELGKQTEAYHYANEARLVNWALTGRFEALDRDSLPFAELDVLAALEERNTLLLAAGLSYEQRKTALESIARQTTRRLASANPNATEREAA